MFSDNDIEAMRGAEAYASDGAKIGPVGDVYLDDATGQPSWVTVSSGLFGTKTFFVPLHAAQLVGQKLTLGFDKATITDAPRLAEDEHLGADEEQRLIEHYRIRRAELVDADAPVATEAEAAAEESDAAEPTTEHDGAPQPTASGAVLGDGLADTDGTELGQAEAITEAAREAAAKADPLRDGSFAGDASKASLIDTPVLDGEAPANEPDETRHDDGL